jgi:hypothetical protein
MPAKIIENWRRERLIPYARNARTHSPKQIAQVAASIQEFGWTNPILAGSDGIIIARQRTDWKRDCFPIGVNGQTELSSFSGIIQRIRKMQRTAPTGEADTNDISQLLHAWSGGDRSALEKLTPIVACFAARGWAARFFRRAPNQSCLTMDCPSVPI